MGNRPGQLVGGLATLLILAVAGVWLLLGADDPAIGPFKPGEEGSTAASLDDDEDDAPARRGDRRPGSSDPTKVTDDGDPATDGPKDGSAGEGSEAAGPRAGDTAEPAKVDPAEINEVIPGYLLIRVLDKDEDRPLPGASVYFPIFDTRLEAEAGGVAIDPQLAGLRKRTNRYGVAAWRTTELKAIFEALAEHKKQKAAKTGPAAKVPDKTVKQPKKDPKKGKKAKAPPKPKGPTSVLITNLGYADLFERLKIPDLTKGAEVTFRMHSAVLVTGKVRRKRNGTAVRYVTVDVLQTSRQGDSNGKPLNRFKIETDSLGEFALRVADDFLYRFEVKAPRYTPYRSGIFDFKRGEREVSILLDEARGIEGRVVDSAGKGIEGAEVASRNDGLSTVTDADGRFIFDMVKDRIWTNDINLRASAKGYAPTRKKVLANDHSVKIVLKREGTLVGLVVNEKDEPIAGAIVNCMYLEGRARYPWDAVQSAGDGSFEFGGFGKGRVQLSASLEGLFSQTVTVNVKPEFKAGPVKLMLTTGASIVGRITSKAGGLPISGATISLDGKPAASSDEDGSYSLGGLIHGNHTVQIVNQYPIADPQLRQLPIFTTDGKAYYYLPKAVGRRISLGASETIDFVCEPFEAELDRTITLRVVTVPAETATGVQVRITPVFGAPPAGIQAPSTQTFAIDVIDGSYEQQLQLLNGVGYEATFNHNQYFEAKLTSAALEAVADGGMIEVRLDRAFIIKGYIKDSEGNGIEGVGVSKDKNNPWRFSAWTDIHGYFEFGQLRAGDYGITAFKTSYYQERVDVKLEDSDPELLEIQLVGANEIRIIVNNSGQPQAGARVHIYRNDAEGDDPDDFKRHFNIGTTDANGVKFINFHWVRNYQIVAYYDDQVAFVNFNNMREKPEREFTIELEPAYDLKGVVADIDTGQPVGGVYVRAHLNAPGNEARDGNFFQLQTGQSSGSFSFRVPVGSYSFYVPRSTHYEQLDTAGSTVPSGTTDVLLDLTLRDDIKGNYAQITALTVPSEMTAGEEYEVRCTVVNRGTTTWSGSGGKPYRLGSQSPRDNITWGLSRVPLPDNFEIRPGETYTFIFTVTAPSTAGQKNMQWRMVQDGVQWFGQYSRQVAVTVTSPTPPPSGD